MKERYAKPEVIVNSRTGEKRPLLGERADAMSTTQNHLQVPVPAVRVNGLNDDLESIVSGQNVEPNTRMHRRRDLVDRKPSQRRLVEKSGKRNVRSKHIPRGRYMEDIFTTVIDMKWKWVVLMFALTYMGSWLFFGLCWWLIVVLRAGHGKCFDNVNDFTESFMLSLETQLTIGYGGRSLTGKCPETVILILVQSIVGLFIDAWLLGLIFAKIARPGKRQSTILFSHNAVITKRDGKMCFMFQVADVRKRQLGECVIRLHLIRTYITKEGKVIKNHQDQLRVGFDWVNIRDDSDRVLLLYPSNMCHVIDRKSPFYNMTPEKLADSDWELVAIFEGTVEATGCTVQARSSYLASEISWGYDFIDIAREEDWDDKMGLLYLMKRMSQIERAQYVPFCSPREYYSRRKREPEDVYAEQDELWEDTNFLKPEELDETRDSSPTESLESLS